MNPIRFAAAHAAHRDWRVALRRALDDMLHDARVATAHAAGGGDAEAHRAQPVHAGQAVLELG